MLDWIHGKYLVYFTLDWIHKNSRNRISYVRLDHTLYSIKYGITAFGGGFYDGHPQNDGVTNLVTISRGQLAFTFN